MICLAAGGAFVAQADVVRWLYDVEVQVASQSAAERQRAGRVALAEVLRRVTGMAELPAHPDVQAALDQPDRFYARYKFVLRPLDDAVEAVDAASQGTFLAIAFEPDAVLNLLRRAGLPVWAANRPTVLAWVAVQRGAQRELVATPADAITQALAARSRQRGLELFLPLMDMADLTLAVSDVWGLFWEEIERVSARYDPDLLLVGRVRQDADGSWTADWHLRSRVGRLNLYEVAAVYTPQAGQAFDIQFERRTSSAETAARAALDGAADALAGRFAVRGDLNAAAVVVHNIDSIASYASLLRYLRSREYIEWVDIRVARPGALTLRLHSRSDSDQLRELLTMSGKLRESPQSDAAAGVLELSWQGSE